MQHELGTTTPTSRHTNSPMSFFLVFPTSPIAIYLYGMNVDKTSTIFSKVTHLSHAPTFIYAHNYISCHYYKLICYAYDTATVFPTVEANVSIYVI